MHTWQKEILEKMYKYQGKGLVQITGRQTGKSYTAQALKRIWDDVLANPLTDIKLSEGKVYGSRYYTAEPIGGNWREMEEWCYQTFGDDSYPIWGEDKAPEPAQRWYRNNRKFWFRNEADRTLFVMKWR